MRVLAEDSCWAGGAIPTFSGAAMLARNHKDLFAETEGAEPVEDRTEAITMAAGRHWGQKWAENPGGLTRPARIGSFHIRAGAGPFGLAR